MKYSTEEEVKATDKFFAIELRRQRNEPEGVINPEFLRAVDEGFIVRAQRRRTDDHDMTLIDQDLVESSWRYRAYEISEGLRARRLERFGVRVTPADQLLPRPPTPAVVWKNVVKIAQASLKGDGWVLHMSDDALIERSFTEEGDRKEAVWREMRRRGFTRAQMRKTAFW